MSKYLVLHFLDGSNVRVDKSFDEFVKTINKASITDAIFIKSNANLFNLDYLISAIEVEDED